MATCEDMHEISKNTKKENMETNLKKPDVLRNRDGKKKLSCEIVALANKYGGKLIMGLKDDGTFEGKGIFDIDKDKGIIENICHTKIRPLTEYNIL